MRVKTFFVMVERKCVIILMGVFYGITALKDVSINIPIAAKTHDRVTLQCSFDLEGELLYTLKWYKGGKEFYRYIPKELPNTRTFTLPGINVDVNKSSHTNLVLTNVQPETTGKYKCEVSTDAPNFYTLMQSGYLFVIDVPTEEPELMLEKDFVEIGYILRVNCTTPPSYPPANVTWYLNGKKINDSSRRIYSPETSKVPINPKRIPQITVSTVELEMDERIYSYGKARFRCVVNVFELYTAMKEIVVEEDRPKPRPSSVLGNRDTSTGYKIIPANALLTSALLLLWNNFLR